MLKRIDFLPVNVPYEGEIAQTDRFVPYDGIGSDPDGLPAEKDAKVVIYCRSGSMSAIAARGLARSDYKNVWNLEGGLIAWRQAGYPPVKGQRQEFRGTQSPANHSPQQPVSEDSANAQPCRLASQTTGNDARDG
jgi:3-mercaptopyruvate sulfurtransferase SseA